MRGHVEVADDLEALYVERYADFVRVATAITGSDARAVDVVQETFARALSSIDAFRGEGALRRVGVAHPRQHLAQRGTRTRVAERRDRTERAAVPDSWSRPEALPTFAAGSPRCPSDGGWPSSCATTATATTASSPRRSRSRLAPSRRPRTPHTLPFVGCWRRSRRDRHRADRPQRTRPDDSAHADRSRLERRRPSCARAPGAVACTRPRRSVRRGRDPDRGRLRGGAGRCRRRAPIPSRSRRARPTPWP